MRLKETLILMAAALTAVGTEAQVARKLNVNITPDGKSQMAVYLPEQPTGRAVVGCPGGGYQNLSLQNEGHDWADYFTSQGIAYCVLTYRMPKGDRSLPVADAETAIRTVRDSAEAWGVNPQDVGIMGFSAGGHLASTVSTHAQLQSRPDFSILFYPVISMNERESHKGSCRNFLGEQGQKDQRLVKSYSNQNAVRRHLTPPAIVLTANDDRVVPPVTNAIAYYSAMRRSGNDCALYVYPTGGHGFGFRSTWAYHDQMLADLRQWLAHLKAPRTDAVRVACIGNSITDGSGIDMAEALGYPAQLQRLLGSAYNVRNYGVGARTMSSRGDHPYMIEQAWRDAKDFLASAPEGQAVAIIKLGTNDSKPENWVYAQNDYEKDLRAMIDTLKALPSKPKVVLCTPIPAFKPTWNINDSVIANHISPIIYKIAKKNKLKVVDLHSLYGQDEGTIQADGIHPNDKGARRMAEIIKEALKNIF